MILTLHTERLRTLPEVRAFLDGSHPVGTVKLTDFLEVPLIDMPPKWLI